MGLRARYLNGMCSKLIIIKLRVFSLSCKTGHASPLGWASRRCSPQKCFVDRLYLIFFERGSSKGTLVARGSSVESKSSFSVALTLLVICLNLSVLVFSKFVAGRRSAASVSTLAALECLYCASSSGAPKPEAEDLSEPKRASKLCLESFSGEDPSPSTSE